MPDENVRKFKRPLPVELTDDEKVKKGHKAGSLKKAIAKVRAEMKLATADHKEQLKQHQANLDGILDDLETGTEVRSVECFERQDFAKKKAEVVRTDTSEVVESRSLSAFELQTKVPGTAQTAAELAAKIPAGDDADDFNEEEAAVVASATKKRGRGRPRKEATA
jgi:hypothetical protein